MFLIVDCCIDAYDKKKFRDLFQAITRKMMQTKYLVSDM